MNAPSRSHLANGDSTSSPRWRETRKSRPSSAWAALAEWSTFDVLPISGLLAHEDDVCARAACPERRSVSPSAESGQA
jgi:hypothetical protein